MVLPRAGDIRTTCRYREDRCLAAVVGSMAAEFNPPGFVERHPLRVPGTLFSQLERSLDQPSDGSSRVTTRRESCNAEIRGGFHNLAVFKHLLCTVFFPELLLFLHEVTKPSVDATANG